MRVTKSPGRFTLRRQNKSLVANYRRLPYLAPAAIIGIAFAAITSPWLVSHNNPTLRTGLPGILGALTLIAVTRWLLTKRASLKFDKQAGFLEIHQGQSHQKLPLSEVKGVKIEEIQTEQTSSGTKVYRLDLLLTNGQSLPLTEEFSQGYATKQKAAEEIESFLRAA